MLRFGVVRKFPFVERSWAVLDHSLSSDVISWVTFEVGSNCLEPLFSHQQNKDDLLGSDPQLVPKSQGEVLVSSPPPYAWCPYERKSVETQGDDEEKEMTTVSDL